KRPLEIQAPRRVERPSFLGTRANEMRRAGRFLAMPVCAALAFLLAQQPAERPFKIIRLDPALDKIVAPSTKLETLGEHFGLSEGPVWIKQGNNGHLLFSDCAANVIYKWAPSAPFSGHGELSVFLENSGFTGKDNLNVGQQTITGGRVAILLI